MTGSDRREDGGMDRMDQMDLDVRGAGGPDHHPSLEEQGG
jgi:hypothetical protein